VGWGVVEVEVSLLDTLAVVTLGVRETKKTFFQEGVLLVPEREGNVLQAMGIAYTGDAVLSPSVCARSGVVVGEVYREAAVSSQVPRAMRLCTWKYLRLHASPSAL